MQAKLIGLIAFQTFAVILALFGAMFILLIGGLGESYHPNAAKAYLSGIASKTLPIGLLLCSVFMIAINFIPSFKVRRTSMMAYTFCTGLILFLLWPLSYFIPTHGKADRAIGQQTYSIPYAYDPFGNAQHIDIKTDKTLKPIYEHGNEYGIGRRIKVRIIVNVFDPEKDPIKLDINGHGYVISEVNRYHTQLKWVQDGKLYTVGLNGRDISRHDFQTFYEDQKVNVETLIESFLTGTEQSG